MSKKYMFTTLVAATLAMFAALPSAFAVGNTGDIRSIQAVPASAYPTVTPLTVGETFAVRVRLLNENFQEAKVGKPHQWKFTPSWFDGINWEIPDGWMEKVSTPALRLAIGGKIVNANYVAMTKDGYFSGLCEKNDYYTDLYFEYTVKEGELGQPVRMVTHGEDGTDKIVTSEGGFGAAGFSLYDAQTYLNGYGSWKLSNDLGSLASFKFDDRYISQIPGMDRTYPDSDGEHMLYSKVFPGINVKAIDFAGEEDSENGWREVYAGSGDFVGAELALTGRGPATVYVWTEDDAIATVESEEVNADGHKVLAVQLGSDGNPTPFKVVGQPGHVGEKVKVYLASTKEMARDAQDKVIEDTVLSRTLKVVADDRVPSISLERASDRLQTFDVTAKADYRSGTRVRISTPQPYTAAFTLKLNLTKDGVAYDPNTDKYFKILPEGDDPAQAQSITTVNVGAGSKETYFTIYGLGSNAELADKGVKIDIEVAAADAGAKAYFQKLNGATVKFIDEKPTVQEVKAPKTGMAGGTIDLEITLADNWRDLQADATINPVVVHELEITIGGAVVYGKKSETAFVEGRANTYTVTIPASALTNPLTPCTVRAKDATHTSWSDPYEFTIAVSRKEAVPHFFETDLTTAAIRAVTTVTEGETAYVRVDLSEQYTATNLYAYLVVAEDGMTNYVTTATAGAEIDPNRNPLRSDLIPISFIDGTAGAEVKLEVKLSEKATWEEAKDNLLSGYATNTPLIFTVVNAAPECISVHKSDTQVENSGIIKVPGGTETSFEAEIVDPGLVDNETLEVMWIIDGQGDDDDLNAGTIEDGVCKMDLYFPDENVDYKVLVLARDKDSAKFGKGDGTWNKKSVAEGGDCIFTFTARAGAMPTPVIEFANDDTTIAMFEDGDSEDNSFVVKMNEFPSPKDCFTAEEAIGGTKGTNLYVKVSIIDISKDGGVVKILDPDDENAKPTTSIVLAFADARSAKSGKTVRLDVDSQNGGMARPSKFKIKAEVINTQRNKAGQRWKDYFAVNQKSVINMYNRAPTLRLESADPNTSFTTNNNWIAGQTVTLKWTITDTLHDVTGGLFRVRWDIANAANQMSELVTTNNVIEGGTVARTTASGTYKFVVPDCREGQIFTVRADDGEGGEAVYEFAITISPTKKIAINVVGPGSTDSKYSAAEGLGAGHVFISTRDLGSHYVNQFRQTWSFGITTSSVNLFASGFGYGDQAKADFGGSKYNAANVNADGEDWSEGEKYYTYTDKKGEDEKDEARRSYFYAWQLLDDNGKVVDTYIKPQVATNSSKYASREFKLGELEGTAINGVPTPGSAYKTVQTEAIFAREYLAGDNVGDINADGVPDVVVQRYALGGSERGSMPENDLADLSKDNPDEDFLPETGRYLFNSIVPGIKDTWTTGINPFTAKLEVRGIGEGLNDSLVKLGIDGVLPAKRNYTRAEMRAWEEAGYDEKWSPENPTDPDKEDTDGDGLPDGYEYYYWYWAHVGTYDVQGAGTNWTHLTGERYDPFNPTKGKLISWQEIEETINPTKHHGNNILDKDLIDTDCDGLPDLLEFNLGTNPFHWDSDGDGVPDGWEVFRSGSDPLKADAGSNPDGDFMAYMSVPMGYHILTAQVNEKGREISYAVPTEIYKDLVLGLEEEEEYAWLFRHEGKRYAVLTGATEEEAAKESLTNFFKHVSKEIVKIEGEETESTNVWGFIKKDLSRMTTFAVDTLIPDKDDVDEETKETLPDEKRTLLRGRAAEFAAGTMFRGKPLLVKINDRVMPVEMKGAKAADFNSRTYQVLRYGKRVDEVGGVNYPVYVMGGYQTLPEGAKIVQVNSVGVGGDVHLYLIHHMVYQRKGFYFPEGFRPVDGIESLTLEKDMGTGFNPLTAWHSTGNPYNKVSTRWIPNRMPKPSLSNLTVTLSGDAVNTAPFTALDEFLLMNFHHMLTCCEDANGNINEKAIKDLEIDIDYSSQENISKRRGSNQIWEAHTTRNGYKVYDQQTTPNHAAAADSDGDGVPDGWELYVACGPGTDYAEGNDGNFYKHGAAYSPLNDKDGVKDMNYDPITGDSVKDMILKQEFRGLDSCKAYKDCPSIGSYVTQEDIVKSVDNNGVVHLWLNKFWPTDPWSSDTDCDGITDSEEANYASYGSTDFGDVPSDNGGFCIPGGGLNPCAWDTDLDGLPDAWEAEFEGKYITPRVILSDLDIVERTDYLRRVAADKCLLQDIGGMDLTNMPTVTYCYMCAGMNGTVPDSFSLDDAEVGHEIHDVNNDFDYDGLDPWQEYMTGMIRAFRYDDVLSPWDVEPYTTNKFTLAQLDEYLVSGKPLNPLYAKVDAEWITIETTNTVVDADSTTITINKHQIPGEVKSITGGSNPNLVFGIFDAWTAYGSKCRRKWDTAYGHWYFFPDGPNHCLKKPDNAYFSEIIREFGYDVAATNIMQSVALGKYPTTDPREADSDHDGMDDYYELFHGLNPLYGGVPGSERSDLVSKNWGSVSFNALSNYWTKKYLRDGELRGETEEEKLYDFAKVPWMAGDPAADPDGDDIRNYEEAIQANAQATDTWLHTDPSPLWMTDVNHLQSIVNKNYRTLSAMYHRYFSTLNIELGDDEEAFQKFDEIYAAMHMPETFDTHYWGVTGYNFEFEMNEGFDSDYDGVSDFQEGKTSAEGQSNPQDAHDPYRRQAMYFPGVDSALQARHDPVFAVSGNSDNNFLQFTVECWVKPDADALTREQVILERVIKTNNSNPVDPQLLRRNFQLGITGGHFYAAYDHNGTGETRVMAINKGEATSDWTHLAATYDGTALKLYVNGLEAAMTSSLLHPTTRAYLNTAMTYWRADINAPWLTNYSTYELDNSAIIYGASASTAKSFLLTSGKDGATWDDYCKFYKGYLDEIRIWDGVRKIDSEIRPNMSRRFTKQDLIDNRNAVYDAWQSGATRTVNRANVTVELPAEIVYHYNFSSSLAAATAYEVATAPFGYHAPAGKAAMARPEGWADPWITNLVVRSTVYKADDYIPWIPNTFAHLPRFDGTTHDSVYWSEDYAGSITASDLGYTKLAFPLTNELYVDHVKVYTSVLRRPTRDFQLLGFDRGIEKRKENIRYFAEHGAELEGTDLLPLGGAYVKYCGDYWDGQGPTTICAVTGTDEDNDGLPDWWEQSRYGTCDNGPDYIDPKTGMTALDEYRRALGLGAHPFAAKGDTAYLQKADQNNNGLPDWWEKLYALTDTLGTDDSDNDGLSNFTEYLLSEVFDLRDSEGNRLIFDPRNAYSIDPKRLDYFTKIGKLYAGEIFTDHDLIEDSWEDLYADKPGYVSRLSHDATSDNDGDGWTARSEARYSQMSREIAADKKYHYDVLDQLQKDHPVPTVKVTLTYTGKDANGFTADGREVANVSAVVAATSDPKLQNAYDAIWQIPGTNGETADEKSDSSIYAYTFNIGRWSERHVVGNLTPGNVKADSIVLQTAFNPSAAIYTWKHWYNYSSDVYRYYEIERGTREDFQAAQRKYGTEVIERLKTDTSFNDMTGVTKSYDEAKQTITLSRTINQQEFCTINLETGEFDIDLGAFKGIYRETDGDEDTLVSCEDLTYRFAYSANPSVGLPRKAYLGEATTGFVREGKNSFVAWLETVEENGKYDVGEPFGYIGDIDVGWNSAEVKIDLTQTHPIFARLFIKGGETDREFWYGNESGNWQTTGGTVPSERNVRIRVVRTLVNNMPTGTTQDPTTGQSTGRINIKNEVLLDKELDLEQRNYLHEGDFLATGAYDLDWANFSKDVANNSEVVNKIGDVTSAVYRIVLGNGSVDPDQTNNVASVAISRTFDSTMGPSKDDPKKFVSYRKVAKPFALGTDETSARPTLVWGIGSAADNTLSVYKDAYNSYPVFHVRVYDAAMNLVYDSGYVSITEGSIDGKNLYHWTPPISVGDKVPGTGMVFKNGANYYYTVAMLNSKFKDDPTTMEKGSFYMNVPENNVACGTAKVSVKYFGPTESYSTINNAAVQVDPVIRVQAFATPDFTGRPIASGYLENKNSVTNSDNSVCATLTGIPAGTYYFRAFIDSNDNGICEDWESQGWLCQRGVPDVTSPFSPTGIKYETKTLGAPQTVVIYLEDMDTDHDGIPDAYEFAKNGDLKAYDTGKINDAVTEIGIALYDEVSMGLSSNKVQNAASAGMSGTILSTLQRKGVAALALGFDLDNLMVDIHVEGLAITGAKFENGAAVLTIKSETNSTVDQNSPAAGLYQVTGGKSEVTVSIQQTTSLSDANWTTIGTGTLSLGQEETDVTVPLKDSTSESGFFRVVIE